MEDKKKWFKIPKDFSIKNIKKDQLMIIFLVGVLLLVIALPTEQKKEQSDTYEEETVSTAGSGIDTEQDVYLSKLERRLENVLSHMEGTGKVTVMITLESSAEKVVEKDIEADSETVTETDSQGGTRTTQNSTHGETTVYNGDNTQSQEPYVSKELSPQVEGVVVLAEGGDNAVVKQNITEAVQALFGIDTHKIRVMKKS